MVEQVSYDALYSYDMLSALIKRWAEEKPELMGLESIGRSWQDREIWMVTLTNTQTGPALDKPGFLVEANIHGSELASSFAALHLIHRLLDGYESDDRVQRLLDTRAVYVAPRLSPDGAEAVLDEGRFVRSSVRPHPHADRERGLHQCDADGDGRALFMRVPDRHGAWKACSADARLLVPRDPDEEGGQYFRLFLEGVIVDYDGATVPAAAPYEGLDLGMNFQGDWSEFPERPRAAGPFSGSEPEIQALMRFAVDHPNITGYVTCHTFGGVHLRPPLNADDDLPQWDLEIYEEVGRKATELTGYTAMSYDDLKHEPYRVKGGQIDWFYNDRGVFSWITEFWNPLSVIGTRPYTAARWLVNHPVEEALRLIRWSDEELAGEGFVDWYAFDHPQLGPVELGGWDIIRYWYNAPLDRVEREMAPHTEWVIFQALSSPRLEVRSLSARAVAPGVYRVQLVVVNAGWLPTYVSRRALDRRMCQGISVDLMLPPGAKLLSGSTKTGLGELEGRCGARTSTTWWGHVPGTPDLAATEWLVLAAAGASLRVRVRHDRAGAATADVRLDS